LYHIEKEFTSFLCKILKKIQKKFIPMKKICKKMENNNKILFYLVKKYKNKKEYLKVCCKKAQK